MKAEQKSFKLSVLNSESIIELFIKIQNPKLEIFFHLSLFA
jgi:hypothetical protein